MNVTVLYKWGRDPEETFVYEDGSIKLRRDRLVASDDDAAAIANARQVAEATGGQLVGATIGSGDATWAMARGAARAVSMGAFMPSVDNARTAAELAQAVRAAGDADLVVMGDAREAAAVPGALASQLGLPLVAGVQDIQADLGAVGCVIAHSKAGKVVETLRVKLPALVAIAATENEKNVPSIKQMLAAKKAPLDKVDGSPVPETGIAATAHRTPEIHRATIFDGTPDQAAAALVGALQADGAL